MAEQLSSPKHTAEKITAAVLGGVLLAGVGTVVWGYNELSTMKIEHIDVGVQGSTHGTVQPETDPADITLNREQFVVAFQ